MRLRIHNKSLLHELDMIDGGVRGVHIEEWEDRKSSLASSGLLVAQLR